MKNAIIIVAVLGVVGFLASCAGDHVCSCTVTTTGAIESTTTVDTTYTDMKKKDAKVACDANDGSVSAWGQTVTTECELK